MSALVPDDMCQILFHAEAQRDFIALTLRLSVFCVTFFSFNSDMFSVIVNPIDRQEVAAGEGALHIESFWESESKNHLSGFQGHFDIRALTPDVPALNLLSVIDGIICCTALVKATTFFPIHRNLSFEIGNHLQNPVYLNVSWYLQRKCSALTLSSMPI